MLVVTTETIAGWEIQRVCGEVFGLLLRVHDRPRHEAESDLADSHIEVIARMLEHARSKGGNAVVGLRFDSAPGGDGCTELCAYGTAVVAIPTDDGARQTATALGYGQPAAPTYQQTYRQPGYGQYPAQGRPSR